MKNQSKPQIINSVSELHRLMGLAKPNHPLITLLNHTDENTAADFGGHKLVLNFYNITIKHSFQGQMKYGKGFYDFDEGSMSFMAPGQVLTVDSEGERNKEGWTLLFHPDLIRGFPLSSNIKKYSFFSYSVNEALHLSGKEEEMISQLVRHIEQEYCASVDLHSQNVIVSSLELLLNYCNRFYSRQFMTRKMATSDLLQRFENLLEEKFKTEKISLPTVKNLAEELNISANYLSDMLRTLTGQNTQQHIHAVLIEKAKEKLSTTELTINEIAYELGFEHAQSFSKLFKIKTEMTPTEFRVFFN